MTLCIQSYPCHSISPNLEITLNLNNKSHAALAREFRYRKLRCIIRERKQFLFLFNDLKQSVSISHVTIGMSGIG